MTEEARQGKPDAVPAGLCPSGEIRSRWEWVEAEVWTERMLTALEQGVVGGTWYSLMDKIYALATLRRAFAKVKARAGAAGIDHVTVKEFEHHLEANLAKLSQALREGRYQPQGIRRQWIDKPGSKEKRPLGIPTVRDRVVQAAVRMALEPIWEREFAAQSYGFRPKRGCKDALRRVDHLLRQGYQWVVDADLKGYFDSIPHAALIVRVQERVTDGRVLKLLTAFLKARVMETADGWIPEEGTPQGAVISPLLANLYLNPLDHQMAEQGWEMVRYADDFVILCRDAGSAARALAAVQAWVSQAGLQLHPSKTRIVNAQTDSFDFLGYRFQQGRKWPRAKSLAKFKDAVRAKTRRTSGVSLAAIITDLNRAVQGWFGYYQHSPRYTFLSLDGWIRMRLRSLLRRRRHLRGRGRGRDHQHWPNRFFAEQGLFSLVTAHALARQSSRR